MDVKRKKRLWWIYGGTGSALLGLGVSCAVESGFLKHADEAWYIWATAGTISLCFIVAGVVFLIRAGLLDFEIKNQN
ncbi:hypothetical protein LCGC14_1797720 [marine sediment metagenome]|uniref:Lipoprotein n=2 Tax=root TaxID=1 RepID=A0A831QUV9_9FLAO|nr:hypothetical protein [Pricia antarctica]